MFLHAIDEGAAAYVEVAGGVGLVAVEAVQGTLNKFFFDAFEADAFLGEIDGEGRGGGGGAAKFLRKFVFDDGAARGEDEQALEHVF